MLNSLPSDGGCLRACTPTSLKQRIRHFAAHIDLPLSDSPEDIAHDVAAVGQIRAVPTILDVLCNITGMRFAAVARVTDNTWTACAVKDEDSRYRDHHTPKLYNIESYVSVPIILKDGRYFGNLCAIDPAPAKISEIKIVDMFTSFAALISLQLDTELEQEKTQSALKDERAAAEFREQFIAILGHDLRNPLHAVSAGGEILERKLTDPELISIAARIRTNAKRMRWLIDDVWDFARGCLGGRIGIQIEDTLDCQDGLNAVVKELQDGQLSHAEIAASTRLPLGSIKSHVRRALNSLRRTLRRDGLVLATPL